MQTMQVSNDLYNVISAIAADLSKSKAYVLKQMLSAYIELQEDAEDIKLAEEAIKNDDGIRIPLEEIERRYGLGD